MCLNLTHLSLGMHTSISDLALQNILSTNCLQYLQHFKCAQTSNLTMKASVLYKKLVKKLDPDLTSVEC